MYLRKYLYLPEEIVPSTHKKPVTTAAQPHWPPRPRGLNCERKFSFIRHLILNLPHYLTINEVDLLKRMLSEYAHF